MAAADLDGDGVTDLVAVNAGSRDISVLLGTGGGAVEPEQRFVGHRRGGVTSITVADLDLDGLADLVIAGSVLLQPRP